MFKGVSRMVCCDLKEKEIVIRSVSGWKSIFFFKGLIRVKGLL